MKDRIKAFQRVKKQSIRANPKNWRLHTQGQREAMATLLNRVGFAGALLLREISQGQYELIDGHMRLEELPDDSDVPALILDVTEEEAELLLASYDPLGAMATAEDAKLQALIASLDCDDDVELNDLLGQIIDDFSAGYTAGHDNDGEADDPNAIWGEVDGTPEYVHDDLTSASKIIVHFATQADRAAFANAIGQKISEKTKSLWYPAMEHVPFKRESYE